MRFRDLITFIFTVTFLLVASPLADQSAAKATVSSEKHCTDLDSWAGEWEVKDMTGAKIGKNVSIKPIAGSLIRHGVYPARDYKYLGKKDEEAGKTAYHLYSGWIDNHA